MPGLLQRVGNQAAGATRGLLYGGMGPPVDIANSLLLGAGGQRADKIPKGTKHPVGEPAFDRGIPLEPRYWSEKRASVVVFLCEQKNQH